MTDRSVQDAITTALEACYQDIGITNPSPEFDAKIRKLASLFLLTYCDELDTLIYSTPIINLADALIKGDPTDG